MSTPITKSPYTTLTNIGISQLLMKYLQLEGVNTIFGIPGATFVDLLNLLMLNRATMKYVVCKQETGAGYMADGYHRVSGNLGVVLVTSGPGATNALTGAMNAQAGRTSMLVITGEQKESQFGSVFEAQLRIFGKHRTAFAREDGLELADERNEGGLAVGIEKSVQLLPRLDF